MCVSPHRLDGTGERTSDPHDDTARQWFNPMSKLLTLLKGTLVGTYT